MTETGIIVSFFFGFLTILVWLIALWLRSPAGQRWLDKNEHTTASQQQA
jgi:hypothetical protein